MRIGLGVLALPVGARLSIPMLPVPMTLQTLALCLIGAFGSPFVAVTSVALYLVAGALGAPVFAEGASGFAKLSGPSAGYLWAFLPAVLLVSVALRKPRHYGVRFSIHMAAHVLVLTVGAWWLGRLDGFYPFIPAACAKSLLAALGSRRARDADRR